MKNREKYAREINAIDYYDCYGDMPAMYKGTLVPCLAIRCKDCDFFCYNCEEARRKWANEEAD